MSLCFQLDAMDAGTTVTTTRLCDLINKRFVLLFYKPEMFSFFSFSFFQFKLHICILYQPDCISRCCLLSCYTLFIDQIIIWIKYENCNPTYFESFVYFLFCFVAYCKVFQAAKATDYSNTYRSLSTPIHFLLKF